MIEIKLTQNKIAIVDDIDKQMRRQSWIAQQSRNGKWYACRREQVFGIRERFWMHREIMESILGRPLEAGEFPDHIDNDTLNNRRSNLRVATQSQNEANKKKNKGVGKFKGVSYDKKSGKWRAYIQKNKEMFWLGRFDSQIEAAKVYNQKAIELFGEYAQLNEVENV